MSGAPEDGAKAAGGSDTQSSADARARTPLVRQYREALRRYFERRLRNRADAEDLTQEVLVRLLRQQALAAKSRPGYIFVAARSVLVDHVRHTRVRALGALAENADVNVESPSAEQVYVAQERVASVMRLVEQLTPRAREVFLMHRVDGLSYSEIARTLGVGIGTVEKHMSAALLYLIKHTDGAEQ